MHHKINSNNSRCSYLHALDIIYLQKCLYFSETYTFARLYFLKYTHFYYILYIVSLICIFKSKSICARFVWGGMENIVLKNMQKMVWCVMLLLHSPSEGVEEVLVERIYAGI